MIFHTIHTITIGRYMDMAESDNHKLMLRYWLPVRKKRLISERSKLNIDFNKLINVDEIVKMYEIGVHKMSMLVRIEQIIPSLYNALMMEFNSTGKITKDEELLTAYKELCGRDLKTKDDIEYLKEKQTRLLEKYNELYPEGKKKEEISLTKIVHILEDNSPHPIDRNCKLYELAGYIERSKERKLNDGRD